MGPIGGFLPAHFLDQLFEPGRSIEGSEIALQSRTDGVADRSAGLLVQGLLWGLVSACAVLGHRHVPFRSTWGDDSTKSRTAIWFRRNRKLQRIRERRCAAVTAARPRRAGRGLYRVAASDQ